MRKIAISITTLLSIVCLHSIAATPLNIHILARDHIANHEYYLDVDNCFAPPFTHQCETQHFHHFQAITNTHSQATISRDEPIPANKVMYSVVGIRHPYQAPRPVICVTPNSDSDTKAFVPTHVNTIHLFVYKTWLGLGPERCDIFY